MKYFIIALLLSLNLFASSTHKAKVLESLNSGGYTYIQVEEGTNKYWIAMTQRDVKVDQLISFNEQGWMQKFHSKTLNRTFDKILFASDIETTANKIAAIKPNIMTSNYEEKGSIAIAELFKNRDRYSQKTISIRGEVTKTSIGIIKRNWVHISDGSRFQNMDDIVFTTTDTVPNVGDIVSAKGTVILDKDFGYGYFYPVIIEKSSFKSTN